MYFLFYHISWQNFADTLIIFQNSIQKTCHTKTYYILVKCRNFVKSNSLFFGSPSWVFAHSRNFCNKCVRLNFWSYHTVLYKLKITWNNFFSFLHLLLQFFMKSRNTFLITKDFVKSNFIWFVGGLASFTNSWLKFLKGWRHLLIDGWRPGWRLGWLASFTNTRKIPNNLESIWNHFLKSWKNSK